VHTLTGEVLPGNYLPPGFAGAALPFLAALRESALLSMVERRVAQHQQEAREGAVTHYYDEALILFGAGWMEGRYRLNPRGQLQLPWVR
jgi:endoglucanase